MIYMVYPPFMEIIKSGGNNRLIFDKQSALLQFHKSFQKIFISLHLTLRNLHGEFK